MERSARVLIVDDDEAIIRLLADVMRQQELDFDIATNGYEALQLLSKRRYALVLLDLEMPVLNGIELLKTMRNAMLRLPVVFVLSARTRDFEDLDDTVVNCVVRKPFNVDELAELVAQTIERVA